MGHRRQLCSCSTAPAHSVRRFILHGYRPLTTDQWQIFASLGYLHNESGNIFTHAAAFVLFGILAVRHFCWLDLPMSASDAAVSLLFFGGVLTCYALSSIYHLQSCHCVAVYQRLHACDLLGVVACILGSFYIGLWVAFRCQPTMRLFYMSLISGLVLPLLFVASSERLRENHWLMIPLFCTVVASGLVPSGHWLVHNILPLEFAHVAPLKWTLLSGILWMYAFYLLGVLLFVLRFPERLAPGRFDLFLSSHQLWHVCVAVAPLLEYLAALRCMQHTQLELCALFA
eukprot:GGOE01014167.1.p1 GENE.GGOE01014167.1~~GGOE01014167.1.p1  ORF type:complete len:286 (-),score=91.34 GGOE01014167.1:297-1154(-)